MLGELTRQTVYIIAEVIGYHLSLFLRLKLGIIRDGPAYGDNGVLLLNIYGVEVQPLARSAILQASYIHKPGLQAVDILGVSLG